LVNKINTFEIKIVVNYEEVSTEIPLIASFNNNVENLSKEIREPQVEADYDAFIINVEAMILDEYNFELVNFEDSKFPNSVSRYYHIFPRKNEKIHTNILYDLRISDHNIRDKRLSIKKTRNATNNKDVLKLNNGKAPKFRLKNIVVNNIEYDTYEDAICAVEETLIGILNKTKG
jgi:hypothetical protein